MGFLLGGRGRTEKEDQMSKCVGLAVFLAMVFVAGCAAPPPAEPEVDLAAEEQAIRDLSAQWLVAAQERDGDAIDGIFAADATTIFDGNVLVGIEAIRAARDEGWAEDPEEEITWETTSILVAAAGDFAVERGHWIEQEPGDDADHGEFVTVWKKTGGNWKVLYDAGTELDDEDDDEDEDEDDDDEDKEEEN